MTHYGLRPTCFHKLLSFCCGAMLMALSLATPAWADEPPATPNTTTAAKPPVQPGSGMQLVSDLNIDLQLSPKQRELMYAELAEDVRKLELQNKILKTVVKLASPTVVHIEAEKRDTDSRGYGRGQIVEETGSGVVIEHKGKFYVLTNRHVIKGAELPKIKVRCADSQVCNPAKVWTDPETDIAVMALEGKNLVPARLGDSDHVDIGDFVLAVGSPFGLSQSVTYGILSAKGRRDLELADGGVRFQDFMQTDASINPGNSGGPLINLRGEVIGINTAIATNSGHNEGIGFSIPINMVMVIARQLIDNGAVTRAFLGVQLDARFSQSQAMELGLPRRIGARIQKINPSSPAEAAKLQAGDVIVKFNGVPVDDDNHLVNIISGFTQAGSEVPVIIYRDRQPLQMMVKLGVNTPPPAAASNASAPAAPK